jgi:TRAP transporter TAXI family solute receptor
MTSEDKFDPLSQIDRPLRLMADWGLANFTKVCAWLAHCLYFRVGRSGLCTIRTGQSWVDNINALVAGEVDLTLATPPVFARHAVEGVGQFTEPHSELRSLAVLPHDDAILFAVPDESPIRDLEEIAEMSYPLRLATGPDDGACHAGWACQTILDLYGLSSDKIIASGGSLFLREFPRDLPPLLTSGVANAVMNEAIMVPQWAQMAEARPVRFLSLSEDVLAVLHDKYYYAQRMVPAGRFKGQSQPIRTVDFSNWLVVVTAAMPDDIAYLLTSVMVEQRHLLEAQYTHLPLANSPLAYPIRPDQMSMNHPIEMHRGAQRYYRERGLL